MKVKYDDPIKTIHAWKKVRKNGEQVKVRIDFLYSSSFVYIYIGDEIIELKLEHVPIYGRSMRVTMLLNSDSSVIQQLLRDCYIDYYSKNMRGIHINNPDTEYYMDTVIICDKNGIKYRQDVICFDGFRCIEFWDDEKEWYVPADRGF